jgi:hypothetical protein
VHKAAKQAKLWCEGLQVWLAGWLTVGWLAG